MRISADKEDPGFENFNPGEHTYKVFLDGVEVDHCITADEEEGFVFLYIPNNNGTGFIVSDDGESILSGEKYGEVVIQIGDVAHGN